MKQKKGKKGVSNYPFTFFEIKILKETKCDSAYSDKSQKALSGLKHTITTYENRTQVP